MAPWDEGGQYDWLFTGTDADPLAFENDVTAFDLSEVLDIPAVRTAWLSYVFRRIERTIEDGRPTRRSASSSGRARSATCNRSGRTRWASP